MEIYYLCAYSCHSSDVVDTNDHRYQKLKMDDG
jgi:hypothetical protein